MNNRFSAEKDLSQVSPQTSESELTPRQKKIYRNLQDIGPEIAAFYRDGVKILQNKELETAANLLAHVAREIDGGLRRILAGRKKEKMEWLIIDTTIVGAHPCAAGALKTSGGQDCQALGRSRGGFSTKIHVAVDGLGNPLRFELSVGQQHDITCAEALIDGYSSEYVIADTSYDATGFVGSITCMGAVPVIPPRANRREPRTYDVQLYKERPLVECFINKIKHYRRVFSRFDKLATRYMGFLSFVATIIWLR